MSSTGHSIDGQAIRGGAGTATALRVETDGGVVRVVLDAPAKLNAVTAPTLVRAAELIDQAGSAPDVRAILLTGAGRAFCAGADLAGQHHGAQQGSHPPASTLDAAARLVRALVTVEKPVVCAVNGPAAGVGVSIALACDVIVAHESAYFLLAFTRVGLMPDGGATELVAASLGRSRALQLALLSERLTAEQAHRAGLVWSVHGDDFTAAADAVVRRLADGPTVALGRTKAAINAAALAELDDAFERERNGQSTLLSTDDHAEGVAAFLGRRPPRYRGR